MCHSGLSVYDLSLNCDNSTDNRYNYGEETFSILSFSDLILPSTPCLSENLIEMSRKSSSPLLEIFHMDTMPKDRLLEVSEGEDSFPLGSSLAQLSPGSDKDIAFGNDWFLDSPTTKDPVLNLPVVTAEDFKELVSPAGNLDSESFDLLLGLVGSGPTEVTDPIKDSFQGEVSWLTKTTIAADLALTTIAPDLSFTGLTPVEFGETVAREDKQVLQEIVIPSTVPDNILCDTEVVVSKTDDRKVKTEDQKVAKSSTKSRKRLRHSLEPGTEEYKKKRELNNISVRKSREKARQKQQETEERAEILSAENSRLQARVDSLEKELTILRGLFTNIGATLPPEINNLLPSE